MFLLPDETAVLTLRFASFSLRSNKDLVVSSLNFDLNDFTRYDKINPQQKTNCHRIVEAQLLLHASLQSVTVKSSYVPYSLATSNYTYIHYKAMATNTNSLVYCIEKQRIMFPFC